MGGGFLRKKVRETNLILPAAHGQLETKTWDVRIWILGMLLILNPRLIHSPDFLFDILFNIGLFPKIPENIFKKTVLGIGFAWCGNG